MIFPAWYFLGLERIPMIALVDLGTRVAALAAVFLPARSWGELHAVAFIPSGKKLVGAAIAMCLLWGVTQIRFRNPSRGDVFRALCSGWHLFVSNPASRLSVKGNGFLGGLLATCAAVDPRVSALVRQSPARGAGIVRRLSRRVGPEVAAIAQLLGHYRAQTD
jgi:Polysaccharide biosynthesis protein